MLCPLPAQCWLAASRDALSIVIKLNHQYMHSHVLVALGSQPPKPEEKKADLCTRILPILMPWQQARRAVSMLSPLRMSDTPHRRLAKSTPTYLAPVGVVIAFSQNGRNPRPASTTCRKGSQT